MAALSPLQFCMIAKGAGAQTVTPRSVHPAATDTPIMATPETAGYRPETPQFERQKKNPWTLASMSFIAT
jgi:hypothetical protein